MAGQIDVFISYKLEERALTEGVMRGLRQAGFTAVTNFNIVKSQEFGDAIDKMIRTARLTLVLWTKASSQSDWVRKEARLAHELDKAGKPNKYLGVMVEPVALDLPVDLRGLQMVDLSIDGLNDKSIPLIVAAVVELLGTSKSVSPEMAETSSTALMDEFQLYEYARSLDIATAYEHFLVLYPNGKFAADARRDLRLCKAWYLHPLRRGNVGHTIAALTLVAGVSVGIWGAGQNAGGAGIDRTIHDKALADLAQSQTDLTSANADRTAAEAAATAAADQATATKAEAARLAAEFGRQATRLTEAEAAAKAAAAKIAAAEAEAARLAQELVATKGQVVSLEGELAETRATPAAGRYAVPPPDCTEGGKPGYTILGKCYPADATELDFASTALSDLTSISGFESLTRLDVSNTQITDLAPISGLSNLTVLFVSRTQITDLAPISGLSNLTTLYVSGNQITDLAPISGMSNLTVLSVSETQITDLAPIRGLSKLTELLTPDGKSHSGREEVVAAIKAGSKP